MPRDWKSLTSVASGVEEIRIKTDECGARAHRIVYVARFPEAVYVLHAFEKKTQKTSEHDLDVARARYSEVLRMRKDTEVR